MVQWVWVTGTMDTHGLLKWIVPHSASFPLAMCSCWKGMPCHKQCLEQLKCSSIYHSCCSNFLHVYISFADFFPAERISAKLNDFLCCVMSMYRLFYQICCLLLAKGSIHPAYMFCNDKKVCHMSSCQLGVKSVCCQIFCSTPHLTCLLTWFVISRQVDSSRIHTMSLVTLFFSKCNKFFLNTWKR